MSDCNHTVGTAWTNDGKYDSSWCHVHADDEGSGWDRGGLQPFKFCPECGASVVAEAAAVERKISAWWEDYDNANPPPPPPPPKTAEEIEADRKRFEETIKMLSDTSPISTRVRKAVRSGEVLEWPIFQGSRNL